MLLAAEERNYSLAANMAFALGSQHQDVALGKVQTVFLAEIRYRRLERQRPIVWHRLPEDDIQVSNCLRPGPIGQ